MFGNGELAVGNAPFNRENSCWSFSNFDGYRIPVDDEGKNMLTNQKSQ
jgi:hypothetical protein